MISFVETRDKASVACEHNNLRAGRRSGIQRAGTGPNRQLHWRHDSGWTKRQPDSGAQKLLFSTIDFAVCVDRSDNSWDEFRRGRISSGDSRYLYINDLPPGTSYDYVFSWCFGDACDDMRVPDC